MSNLNKLNIAALAKEVQGLASSIKQAAAETANFKEKLNIDIPKGKKANEKETDWTEVALTAMGIHVPSDEEMRERRENHPATSETLLTVSFAIIAATAKINKVLEKALITTVQTGAYESVTGDNVESRWNYGPESSTAPRDATSTSDPLYPNDSERMPTAMELAEGYNVLATKILPAIASIALGPLGQAIVASISYVGDEIKETIGEEIYKYREAPKSAEEYNEINRGVFEKEEEAKAKGGYEYYWRRQAEQKRDGTYYQEQKDVKRTVQEEDNIIRGLPGKAGKMPLGGIPGGHKGNGEDKQKKGPSPLEVFEGVFSEAQKVGGTLTTIMSTLNIGAHTFVGKMISGFSDTLAVVQAVIQTIQAIQTISSFLSLLPGFAVGGTVPGIGDTDTVPAMLTPGEYVIKKSVVNKFGSGFFEWINGGGLTNSLAGHYAGGGMIAAGRMQSVSVNIPDVKLKGSDLYLSWRRQDTVNTRRAG